MRDEIATFEAESDRRQHISHLWAKLDRQRREPRRTLGENLAAIRGINQIPGRPVKPFAKPSAYPPGYYRLIQFPYDIIEVP